MLRHRAGGRGQFHRQAQPVVDHTVVELAGTRGQGAGADGQQAQRRRHHRLDAQRQEDRDQERGAADATDGPEQGTAEPEGGDHGQGQGHERSTDTIRASSGPSGSPDPGGTAGSAVPPIHRPGGTASGRRPRR